MRLFLVRHGTAEDKGGGSDAERALTPEGREEVADVSGSIRAAMDEPAALLSSPYLRAEQTAEVLRERLKLAAKLRATDALLPEGGWDALRPVLEDLHRQGVRAVIAVGHNPSISMMVGEALSREDGASIAMAKGAVACLDLDDLRRRPAGALKWLVTPKSLRGARRA